MESNNNTTTVRLVVYDISGGMARQLGPSLLGLDLDCLPHTGVIVFGHEYFFGGGIQRMPHEEVVRQFGIAPFRREVLGKTEKSANDFHAFLDSIRHRFQQSTYDVFRNNCNHFSDAAVRFLLNGVGIPTEIVSLPERVLATPMGQMIAPVWSSMQQRMQEQLVPFNAASPTSFLSSAPSSVATAQPRPAPASSAPAVSGMVAKPLASPRPTLVESIKGLTETTSAKECMVALDTLAKILKNIMGNPHEEKYRRLSLLNEKFQAALGKHSHGVSCLLALGFDIDSTNRFVFMVPDPTKWDKLVMSDKIITAARRKAIKTYLESCNVATADDALKLVDANDSLALEVVQGMFSRS